MHVSFEKFIRTFKNCQTALIQELYAATGGNGRGECEKNIKLRAHNMQTFYSGSAKYTNISRRNQVSMALFLCANIHQADKLFSVHSGGKQCAVVSLRRFLQPEIIPIGIVLMVVYRTFDNFMTYIQGDKMSITYKEL
jgi:hypothetical protein